MKNDKDYKISADGLYRVYPNGTHVSLRGDGQMAESEKRLMVLINGGEPKNEEERAMKKQIDEMKARGITPTIPSNL